MPATFLASQRSNFANIKEIYTIGLIAVAIFVNNGKFCLFVKIESTLGKFNVQMSLN